MTDALPQGTVTILFTDVEGSVNLTNERGDDVAQEILQTQRALVREQVEEHSGHEVKTMGDGFMVAFGSARQAVSCAVAIQRALAANNRSHPDRKVLVRMGLNTGEVIQEEEDLFGAAVDAASRIMSKADGGQVLLAETVKAIMGPTKDVEFVDRGRFRLKGFPERWRLFEVAWEEETPAAVSPAVLERTPFIGRDAERGELRRLLEQALQGHGALAMIGGEPGVGKTRISEEIAAEAQERGLLPLTGHCYEMEGSPPYLPFVEILETAARTVEPDAMRQALGDSAGEVAKLMPELRRLFPDIPDPLELPPEQERHYLFNSIREFLQRASGAQPLLLVLDDLHWADDSTLLLLQHIAQQLGQMPILILGTYRDVELDVGRPLAQALEGLLRQRLAHRVSLRRLPQDGVEGMLRALSGQTPPRALVEVVFTETEGNPFFVEEVFQHLAEEGKLFDAAGKWRPDLEVSELDVPEGVRLVIGRRLQRVGEEVRRVLTAAAVIGRVFSFDLLEALGEVEPDALLDAVDEAERAQLLTATSDGPEARFAFAHELIRQTLISSLSLPRRQRLHLRIAEAVEGRYAGTLEAHASDLAHHLFQAGAAADAAKTVRYLSIAGERALDAAAFEEALRRYEAAQSLLLSADRKGHADLLIKRGAALRSLGRWDEALEDWRRALEGYAEVGESDAVAQVSFDLAWLLGWSDRSGEAVEAAQRGLRELGDAPSAGRCSLLSAVGVNLGLSGDYAGGSSMLDEALAVAEQVGDRRLIGQALSARAGLHWNYLEPRRVVEYGEPSLEQLRSAGDLWALADALWISQGGYMFLGRHEDVLKIAEELEPLADRLGHIGAMMVALRWRGMLEFSRSADIDQFEEAAKRDLELCQSASMPWISHSYTWLGMARFWRGRWEEAETDFREAVKLEPGGPWANFDYAQLALARAYSGERDSVLKMLEEKRGGLPRPGQANSIGSWTLLLSAVEAYALLGKPDQAADLYPLVLEQIQAGVLYRLFGYGLVQTVAGIAAAAGDDWEMAEEHYQTALRQAEELPHRGAQPETRRWYARMLADRDAPGDRDKARTLLGEAATLYDDMGAERHQELAEEMLAQL